MRYWALICVECCVAWQRRQLKGPKPASKGQRREQSAHGREPHVCPVCKGSTTVPRRFYTDLPDLTTCRSCDSGVVWEPRG
jgi:hypothetical protein